MESTRPVPMEMTITHMQALPPTLLGLLKEQQPPRRLPAPAGLITRAHGA
ncbi:MAG TPA: hypothetical protein VNO26_08480 [Candidatus Limnocylindria bacterium]|nr:hypothetical protein [Candidatus Limnocylindria bacterium]